MCYGRLRGWGSLAAVVVVAGLLAATPARAVDHLGLNQKVALICCKYTDSTTTRNTAAQWAQVCNNNIKPFYALVTNNRTSFDFDGYGWYDIGYANSDYQFTKSVKDAIKLADKDINFSNYNRVMIIFNSTNFGGQGSVGAWANTFKTKEAGGFQTLSAACVNEWDSDNNAAELFSHELGHNCGLPDLYGSVVWAPGIPRDYADPWGIMTLTYGNFLRHFHTWCKVHRSWIQAGPRIRGVNPPVGPGGFVDQTITLRPQELNVNDVQIIKVPITTAGGFYGYWIENRSQLNEDTDIPNEGVLISLVNEARPWGKVFVLDPENDRDLRNAPYVVGESYNDPTNNITISVVSQTGDDYNVRVQYGVPPSARPDPMIIPWGAPPHETVDIWVDSSKNSLDAGGQTADATVYKWPDTNGDGSPEGNGDPAWVDHDNRVWVRIRNIGPGAATNVTVNVYQNSPPGMGDSGPEWKQIGTTVFPSIASGGVATSYVTWKPKVGKHTCLKAIIQNLPLDLNTANNAAQENVSHFEVSGGAPKKGPGGAPKIKFKFNVNNPTDRELPVHLLIDNLPDNPPWKFRLKPQDMVLPPNGQKVCRLILRPQGLTDPRDHNLFKPRISAVAPYDEPPYGGAWMPIGGIDLWVQHVRPTTLTINVDASDPTHVGENIYVSGRLEPAVAGATITVEYRRKKRGEPVLQQVKTDAQGQFQDVFAPRKRGKYTIQAFWMGSDMQASAESDKHKVTVVR